MWIKGKVLAKHNTKGMWVRGESNLPAISWCARLQIVLLYVNFCAPKAQVR